MKKLIILIILAALAISCEKDRVLTGMEGQYISGEFLYQSQARVVTMRLTINSASDIGIMITKGHLLYAKAEITYVQHEPGRMYLEFTIDSWGDKGSIQIDVYDYQALPMARLTGMLNVRKQDNENDYWGKRLYFYEFINH